MERGSDFREEFSGRGVYRHFKSTPENPKDYHVEDIATNTETGEIFVIYKPLYEIPDYQGTEWLIRPLTMFNENVEKDGETVPRFKLIGRYIENVDQSAGHFAKATEDLST